MSETSIIAIQPVESVLPVRAKQLLSFGAVGAVGFVVDAVVLTLMSVTLGVDALPSRAVSFTCASLVTWLLNRAFTFGRRAGTPIAALKGEYFRYATIQVIGALLNFAVFLLLIGWRPELREVPVIPLAGGALVALVFNFLMTRRFVYRDGGVQGE